MRRTSRWARRAALALGALLSAGAAGAVGCEQAAPESAGSGGSAVERAAASAQQGATSAMTCVTIVRQGSSGTVSDAQIANQSPPKNYGASANMNAGLLNGVERRALLQFDLSAIPQGPSTNIVSATLNIAKGLASLTTGPGTMEVHRITAPWGESTVTWQSFANAFDPTISATMSNAAAYPATSIQQLVQAWVSGKAPNYGLILTQPGTTITNFWSSEYGNPWERPSLNVCYTVTCAPGFADCNGNGADGCETDLGTSAANCGACGTACSVPNAVAACVAGACAVGACNLGFGDCNGSAADGCETLLTTNASCGACGVACALPNAAASCATGTCTLTACNPGTFDCDGDPKNGCEPMPCVNGSHCASGAGCQSGVCAGGFCASPICTDGVHNGAETDLDCGGGACPPCAVGLVCAAGGDCQSGVCAGGTCQAPACNDGVKNGAETATDCGGSCAPCAVGLTCLVGADCASGVCTAGLCQAPTCNDGVKNGAETAVDCGGGLCAPCAAGKACNTGADCVDQVCGGGICQIASCSDAAQNGGETDVDCGGPCPACPPTDKCQANADCDSGVCQSGFCAAPTCNDGIKNGTETGVDCGGSCWKPEVCNGVDDDCNGLVDDGLGSTTCGVGACQVTAQSCVNGKPQTCVPLAPQAEQCDGLIDDDCDGVVDNGCACVDGRTQSCYTAAPATLGVGLCQAGVQTCAHGQWGACVGEVTPAAETCDGLDNDCNGQADDGLGQTVCGVGECQVATPNCVNGLPQPCVPRAPSLEVCDGLDNDCDGQIDNDQPDVTCGVGACQTTVASCANGQAQACVPGLPQVETCNGIDDDCDGQVDEGNPGAGQPCNTGKLGVCAAGVTACTNGGIVCVQTTQPSAETCNGLDDDCDGVIDDGNPGAGVACSTGKLGACAAGTTVCSGGQLSCQQTSQPTAESCNGLDDDCDGVVDNGNPGGNVACSTGKLGVCAAGTTACTGGQIACNQATQPSAEVCDGQLDQNCDGRVDEGCACVNGATQSCYGGAAGTQGVGLCHAGTQTCVGGQWGACVGQVLPGTETCNGLDDDCDGQTDEGLGTISCGVGQCGRTVAACVNGQPGTCTPGAPTAETCNGLDDDCDGVVDDGNPGGGAACSTGKLGVCAAGTTACTAGALVCNQTSQPTPETCNGLDDNCDGTVDEGVKTTYYRDADGDGYGTSATTTQACSQPAGYVANGTDCNDANAAIKPGAAETCNGVDDNCNGSVDENNPGGGAACGSCSKGTTLCSGGALTCTNAGAGLATYYRDADGDGYGTSATTTTACSQPAGYVAVSGDCNDANASIKPGATETCNGADDNCNGSVDDGAICSLAHASSTCTAGACAISSCASGWVNNDGNAANGCETYVGTSCCPGCSTSGFPFNACTNVAPGKSYSASSYWSSYVPANAAACSGWNSGGFAQQWWQVDLGAVTGNLRGMSFIVDQSPAGNTTHVIYASNDGVNFSQVGSMSGYTSAGQNLWVQFSSVVSARFIRVTTTSSPSWVAWYAIALWSC